MKPLFVCAVLVMLTSPAFAEIYKCKTPSGTLVYQETPCDVAGSQLDHQIVATPAAPTRKSAPIQQKARPQPSDASPSLKNSGPALGAKSDDDGERFCRMLRKKFEENKSKACIMGYGPGGKEMCMSEAQRAYGLANQEEILRRNCP